MISAENQQEPKKIEYYSNDIDWNILKEKYEEFMKIPVAPKKEKLPKKDKEELKKKGESDDENHWDKFYGNNQDKFFKDRKYLEIIFKEITIKTKEQSMFISVTICYSQVIRQYTFWSADVARAIQSIL